MAYRSKTRSRARTRTRTTRTSRRSYRSYNRNRSSYTRRSSGSRPQTVRLVIEQVAAAPATVDGAFAVQSPPAKKSTF